MAVLQATVPLQSKSDRGRRRSNNEDVALTRELSNGYTLLAVADGVGGSRAGEVASAEAAETLLEQLKTPEIGDPREALAQAFRQANARVRSAASERPEVQGMSTTLVAALVRDHQAWIASVGDSRAYLIAGGRAQQLTEDHSLAAERFKAGLQTEEESTVGFGRNIITRSVGSEERVRVDLFGPIELPSGSSLLLCSDGLHDMVSDEAIAGAFAEDNVANRLVALANEAGGADNIAVAVLHRIA